VELKLFKIYNEDCLIGLKKIQDIKFDLVILDPPYNVRADSWDNISNYLEWMCSIISESRRLLKDNGSLYLWGMSKNNDFLRLKLWMDDNINLEFKNWIVWVHECKIHRKPKDKYLNKHEDLLFYAGKNNTFNIVRDLPTPLQLSIFKDKFDDNFFVSREKLPPSQQKIFKNGLQLGSPAKSWWRGDSNISNNKEENLKNFAGFKSEWVCKRIIEVSSNEGNNILIPFAGTGTECLMAKQLNRNFISFEIDNERFEIAKNRIK
jgi:DNA modification methylase